MREDRELLFYELHKREAREKRLREVVAGWEARGEWRRAQTARRALSEAEDEVNELWGRLHPVAVNGPKDIRREKCAYCEYEFRDDFLSAYEAGGICPRCHPERRIATDDPNWCERLDDPASESYRNLPNFK